MNIAPKRAVVGLVVLLVLLATAWEGYVRTARNEAPSATNLLHDIRAKMPWFYRWVDARLEAPTRPRFPRLLVARVVQAETRLSQRRATAAERLAGMGTNAWPVLPALIDALDDGDSSVVWAAASVLARIRVDEYPDWGTLEKRLSGRGRPVPLLRYLLTGRNQAFQAFDLAHRRFALIGLAGVGPAAGQAIPDVINVLRSKEDYDLWPVATRTLRRIGGDTTEVVSSHRRLIADGEAAPNLRASALRALAGASAETPDAPGILRQALQDEKALVRLTAATELWKLGAPPREVLPTVTALLSHKLATIRTGALEFAAEMGPAASPVRPEVARLTSDGNERVRQAAETALKRITAPGDVESAPTNP